MSTRNSHPPMATSRTYQYRKIMKPLLERKRRARINKCLEELKHLIMDIAQMDPDTLAKLEKADILEITIHHLQRQRQQEEKHCRNMEQYWNGFQQCAMEVSRFLQGQDKQLSLKLIEVFVQFMPKRRLQLWRPW